MQADHFIEAFIDAMKKHGVNLDTSGGHPKADGRMHRANAIGKQKPRNNHIWYVLHGDGIPSGAFGDHQLGVSGTWCAKGARELSDDERRAIAERALRDEAERKRHRLEAQTAARNVAERIIRNSVQATSHHPYLARKGLLPTRHAYVVTNTVTYMLPNDDDRQRMVRRGTLFIPSYMPGGRLVGGQQITYDGSKYFIKGTEKTGSYHPIGGRPSDKLVIAEGWATAARIHHATGYPAVAAFDSGNLMPVAKTMRKMHPDVDLIIAADNDRNTFTPVRNPGVHFATRAARESAARVIVPQFDGDGGSDFDDVAQIYGEDEVRLQILQLTS